jgi:hypothetical protein
MNTGIPPYRLFPFLDFLEDTMIRSMILSLAVGAAALAGCMTSDDISATDDTSAVAQNSGGGFQCINKLNIQVVSCTGGISILPINVDIKNVSALNNNDLTVLSNDLNHLSVLDGGILNNDKILNDVEVTVLQDFLNKFLVNVSKNDIDVCTTVLGIVLCK